MIIKSYEILKNNSSFIKHNFFLLYGENFGLKKDIREAIKKIVKNKDDSVEILTKYENEILDNEEDFYNLIYSGSLFSNKKIITIFDATDKLFEKIEDIYNKFPENIFLVIFSEVLEKKSKLRSFFEIEKKAICIPCYLDSERDLEFIARSELQKNNISISREAINILIEKSNLDRNNLRNEIEKIKSYCLHKKHIDVDEVKLLANFSGDHKSDSLVNECLSGNIMQYKKILPEIFTNTTNQILIFRILTNKIQRLLKIKEQEKESKNLDYLISSTKPAIFWKEKPIVKKQLSIWALSDLRKIILEINNTELLCKKNPNISKFIFFNFFSGICKKANSHF